MLGSSMYGWANIQTFVSAFAPSQFVNSQSLQPVDIGAANVFIGGAIFLFLMAAVVHFKGG